VKALPLLAAALVIAAPAVAAPEKAPTKKHKPVAKSENGPKGENDVPLDREHVHLVKPGETLGGIAHRAKVPRILIIEANSIKPPYDVHAGQRLMLPRTRRHTVKEGETGFDIAYHYGVPLSSILVANGLKDGTKLGVGQSLLIPTMLSSGKQAAAAPSEDKPAKKDKPAADSDPADTPAPREAKADHGDGGSAKSAPHFSWPLAGNVRRGYTPRGKANFHDGLDIVAPEGSAARAVASGTVLFAKEEPDSFGRLVVIDHGNGWQSAYGFLNKITVKEGDPVKAHERIGLVGHSGKATRDELHFEIRQDNHPVDPAGLLPAAPLVVNAEKLAVKKVVKKK
jgi:murein DD-endopeptidase MepM/ murein hydrolase activator NlpD